MKNITIGIIGIALIILGLTFIRQNNTKPSALDTQASTFLRTVCVSMVGAWNDAPTGSKSANPPEIVWGGDAVHPSSTINCIDYTK